VTVFTQAPDGALQDVEVFAQSACIDERHGVIWRVPTGSGVRRNLSSGLRDCSPSPFHNLSFCESD
jgi:hypothetical protein